MIRHFDKEYAFLSNFYPATIAFEGEFYPTVEHSFQAAKTDAPEERARVRAARYPSHAKRLGKQVTLRPDWEDLKNGIMKEMLRIKFRDPGLSALLLATGDAELVEGNHWHDRYWGQCDCARCGGQGQNVLGRLLMEVRAELRAGEAHSAGASEQPDQGDANVELTETVIGSESIFEGRIVHLRVDTVRLPDGTESKREIVGHRGAVCIVPVRDDGKVLLIRQFRLAAGKTLLEIPAGTLEEGEGPALCAERELEEETGYHAAELLPLFQAYLAPGYSTELIYAFLAFGLTPTQAHTDADENLELTPLSLPEIETKLQRGEFEDAKTIASLFAALRLLTARREG